MSKVLVNILMNRDGLSKEEATEIIDTIKERVFEYGEDPEELLLDELGLEPDYVLDLVHDLYA